MNSQEFLFLNGLVMVILIAIFLRAGRQRQATRLKLKNAAGEPSWMPATVANKKSPSASVAPVTSLAFENRTEKNLNVFFQHHGQNYEAHEVLNIPAGASIDLATKAYQQALRKSPDPAQLELMKLAMKKLVDRF